MQSCKPANQNQTKHEVWKKQRIGEHRSPAIYRNQFLQSKRCKISPLANIALGSMVYTGYPSEIHLAKVALCDLDLNGVPKFSQITAHIIGNMYLCPQEIGPALRLAYLDQPKGETLHVMMAPIRNSRRQQLIFTLEHDPREGMLLDAIHCPRDQQFMLDEEFIVMVDPT